MSYWHENVNVAALGSESVYAGASRIHRQRERNTATAGQAPDGGSWQQAGSAAWRWQVTVCATMNATRRTPARQQSRPLFAPLTGVFQQSTRVLRSASVRSRRSEEQTCCEARVRRRRVVTVRWQAKPVNRVATPSLFEYGRWQSSLCSFGVGATGAKWPYRCRENHR